MLIVVLLVSHMTFRMFIGKWLNFVHVPIIMLEEFNRRMNSIFQLILISTILSNVYVKSINVNIIVLKNDFTKYANGKK
jgi:hypothetical protein